MRNYRVYALVGAIGLAMLAWGQEDRIGALVQRLQATPAAATMFDIDELTCSDDPRVEPALLAIATAGGREATRAANALAHYPSDEARAALIAVLKAPPAGMGGRPTIVRAEALVAMGPAIAPQLAEIAAGPASPSRTEAAIALGLLGDARAIDPLVAGLAARTPNTGRIGPRDVLARMDDPRVEQALIARLAAATVPEESYTCATLLAERGTPAAVDAVLAAAAKPVDVSNNSVSRALASVRPREQRLRIIARLADPEPVLRRRVAQALSWWDDPESEAALIAAVDDADTNVAYEVIRALGTRMSRASVPKLCATLATHKTFHLRGAAAEALGKIGDQRALNPLIAALKDGAALTQTIAALARLGDPAAVPALVPFLKHRETLVRQWTAYALRDLADARAKEPLAEALTDAEPGVSLAAACALARLKDGRGYDVLIAGLPKADEYWHDSTAVRALGELGDARAVVPIIAVMAGDNSQGSPERCESVAALARIGEPAIEPLGVSLNIRQKTKVDTTGDGVAKRAAWALSRIGGSRAIELLAATVRDGGLAGYEAGKALIAMKDRRACDALLPQIAPGARGCQVAMQAAAAYGAREAIPQILPLLDGTSIALRGTALSVLADLKAIEAVEPLMGMLDRPMRSVGMGMSISMWPQAATALGEIGDPRPADALLAALKAGRRNAQSAAVALGMLRDARAWDLLAANATSPLADARSAAANALGYLGDERAAPLLIPLLDDPFNYVRLAAMRALVRLDDPRGIEAVLACDASDMGLERTTALADSTDPRATAFLMRQLLSAEAISESSKTLAAVRRNTGQDFGTSVAAWRAWWYGR